jgi:hypothetical protein
MPVMDGFEATKQIRAFEEESWNEFSANIPSMTSAGTSAARQDVPKPIRRAVIVALAASNGVAGVKQRIAETGFDVSFCRPFHLGVLCDMLFSGPGMNVVSQFGGVDDSELRAAGYPLQVIRRRSSSIGGKEVSEALGRAVA